MGMVNTEKKLLSAVKTASVPVMIIWILHIIKVIGNFHWGRFGVFPREIDGLAGIIFSPLIHGDFQHLFSNSIPVFFLVTMILFFYEKIALISITAIYLITGLLVWLFAREGVYHIGASGVVYGMVSFVFWNGVFRRSMKAVILSLVIIIMYSGYFAGIVPGQEGISWESHLMGGLTGIVVSFIFKNNIEEDEVEHDPWENDDYTPTDYFLDRDSFDKTSDQRRQDRFIDPNDRWTI